MDKTYVEFNHPLFRVTSSEGVKSLLESGFDPNIQTKNGLTPLIHAAEVGNIEVLKALLEHGVEVNHRDYQGCTALLMLTCFHGDDFEGVKLLLDHGADPKIKDNKGTTPLYYAAGHGNVDVLKLLCDEDVEVDAKSGGRTALMQAAHFGKTKAIELLLEKGADVNAQDNDKKTPLMEAVTSLKHPHVSSENCVQSIQLLLDHGADVGAKNKDGFTPFLVAVSQGNIEAIKILQGQSPPLSTEDAKARTQEGATLLMSLAESSSPAWLKLEDGMSSIVELAEKLIELGAGVNDKGKYDWTPLMCAVDAGSPELVKLMLEKGAEVNARTRHSITPLFIAVDNAEKKLNFLKRLMDPKKKPYETRDDPFYEGQEIIELHESIPRHIEIVELLSNEGADPTVKHRGTTAMGQAHSQETRGILISKKASELAKRLGEILGFSEIYADPPSPPKKKEEPEDRPLGSFNLPNQVVKFLVTGDTCKNHKKSFPQSTYSSDANQPCKNFILSIN